MRITTVFFLICTLLLTGCATTGGGGGTTSTGAAAAEDQHPLKRWMGEQSRAKKKGLMGALVGAATGAATAALTGQNPWAGAAAGAVAGAIAGFLIGKRQDRMYGSRDEAVRRIGYDPSQGYVMRVDSMVFEPRSPSPGDEVALTIRYIVIGPDQDETLSVQSFTGIKYDGEYVMADGPGTFEVERGGGIVESKVVLTLPKKAPTGSYALEALLEDSRGRFKGDQEQPLYLS